MSLSNDSTTTGNTPFPQGKKEETKPSSFSSIADILKQEYGCNATILNKVRYLERNATALKNKLEKKEQQADKVKKENLAMVRSFKANPKDWWYVSYLQETNMHLEQQCRNRQEIIEMLIHKI